MLAGLLALAISIGVVTTPIAPLRYKIEVSTSQEVDLSAMGQAKMTGDVAAVMFVSITMSDSGAGQLAHIVLDSMTITPSGMMEQQFDPSLAGAAKGAFYHVYVMGGKVQGTPKPSMAENPALALMGQAVQMMFPGSTRAGLKMGESFADTTTTSNTSEAGTNTASSVTSWTLKGIDGDAMVFEGSSIGKMSVDGGQNAVTGTNTGTRTMTSTAKGPIKSATLTSAIDISVVPAGMSDAIPVKGTSKVTITQLN